LTGGKQKALLALLLLHADRVVPMPRLVDELWGDDVPDSAQKMVQIFVSQLRKQLPEGLLRTKAPGYLVDLDGHSLDLRRFEELAEAGRTALTDNRAADAAQLLRAALTLWRGPALGEFAEPFAAAESARLEEQQLACTEDRIEADLALGRHAELVGEVDALAGRHPHRERLRGQLMLALYRSGRHGEALEAYRSFRRLLADDLGIDPPTRLKELERRMLQQDPALDPAPARIPALVRAERAPEPGVSTTCPSCRRDVRADSSFCPSCGTALQTTAPEEMLKVVTLLFADLVGSTARADALHPEDFRALIQEYFDAMADEIRAEGGTIEKYVGDEIMAIFGVPTAREDDAVRAVRAARRMLERLATWNAGREPDRRLEIRIGLNPGEVIASVALRGDLLVTGDG